MSKLCHIIYTSITTDAFSESDLESILEVSRTNNRKRFVTGMLLFDKGHFFQVLEGEEPVVDALFEKISRDPRHEKVVIVVREPIRERSLYEWSMGHTRLTEEEMARLPGMNDFLSYGRNFSDISPPPASG
ncbi:MAG: BLUF domain-containing protein [Gammaproteobacteria bacterium]